MAQSYYLQKSLGAFLDIGLWELGDNPYAEITDAVGTVFALNDQWRSIGDHLTEIHTGFAFTSQADEPSAVNEPLENFPGIWLETTMDRLHFKNIAGVDKKIATLDDVLSLDWQNSVLDKDLTAPPGGESVGDRYIVAAGATGAWAGKDDDIAQVASISPTVWSFYTPTEGTVTEVEDENLFYHFDGASWGVIGAFVQHNNTGNKDGGTVGEYYHLTSAEYGGNWGSKNLITTGYLRGASLYFGGSIVYRTFSKTVCLGALAGAVVVGDGNTLVGYNAGGSLGTEANNTLVGADAGAGLIGATDNSNVFLGANAGGSNVLASDNNIFIGVGAGNHASFSGLSNKLIIHNSASLTPLLYGDFSVPELTINGDLKIPDDKKIIFGDTADGYIRWNNTLGYFEIHSASAGGLWFADGPSYNYGIGMDASVFTMWHGATGGQFNLSATMHDINAGAHNVDTRIQGDTVVPLLYVDAGEDAVGIGKVPDVSTAFILDVNGKMKIQTDLTLASGANVNEFSTDGTFAGNSDTAVPTEKAIKTYVDTTHHLFSLIRGTNEYVESTSVTWEEIGTLVFVGTDSWTPTSAKVVSWRSAGSGTYDVRINDVTNSLIIATVTGLSNTAEALNSLGTLSNLSTGEAIWKIEVQTSVGPTDMRLNAIKII